MYKKALIAALISCMTVSAAGCQMNSTKTDTIPDSTADINAAPTAEPAEGESWTEPVVLVKENPPGCRSRPILRAKSAGLSQTA